MIGLISLILWLEKMIRIIMANYFIASIILAFNNFFDLMGWFLVSWTIERRVDWLQHRIGELVIAWKPTILLTIYFVLLLFLFMKSHISFGNIQNNALKIWLTIILLPCTILSLALGIAIALFGWQMVSLEWIKTLAYSVSNIPYAYELVLMTPIWMILPWMITLLIAIIVLRKDDDASSRDILIELDNK